MMLQKRLEYGFNGYQVPPTPRAARSARKRISSWKKAEDNTRMCAFNLLATVAGTLSHEGGKLSEKERKVEEEEEDPLNDQGSCNKSFFVSEIISQAPVMDPQNDMFSSPASGVTFSDCLEKVPSAPKSVNGESRLLDLPIEKVNTPFGCKIEDMSNKQSTNEASNNGKPPVVNNLDSNVKLHNVNLVTRDDDENSLGCTQPPTVDNKTFSPPPRIGDRRIRRLLASKQWKMTPKVNNEVHFNTDAELKPVYCNRKTCYKRQWSLRDYPFKKRRLYELDNFSNSVGRVGSDVKSCSPTKDSMEDGFGFGAKPQGDLGTSGFATKQNPAFQAKDSHVKLKIKSFRVPEFFIEIPETATVGSLKRTVMEAMTAILSGELHVGVMLQGKKIRDDSKTLLQTGICHDNKIDALGFILEPNRFRVPSSLCPEDRSFALPPDIPKPLTRYPPPPTVVIRQEVSDALDPPTTNFGNLIESNHDSAPSPPTVDNRSVSDSMALVTVPAMNVGALAVVPMRNSKRAEAAQRRIRRPFSVSEVEALVQAVEKLGTGRWRDVKLRAFDTAKHRTYVDLKDKWKTLVHTARISPQQRRGEPVPQELLDRVLAAHGYWSHHQAKHQFKHQLQPETCRLL